MSRLSPRSTISAIALGLSLGFSSYAAFWPKPGASPVPPVSTTEIVVARSNLPAGTTLSIENLTVRNVPLDQASPNMIRGLSSHEHRMLTEAISAGQQIPYSATTTI